MSTELGPGAWCWFQDPRCVTDGEYTYAGWVEPEGEITISQFDHETREWELNRGIDVIDYDDHGSPAIHVREDGRVLFMYMEHNADRFRYRVTRDPHDITALSPVESFEIPGGGGNYPQFVDTDDALYLFHRDVGDEDSRDWFVRTSEDDGESWSDPSKVVTFDGGYSLYMRVSLDGNDRVDVAATPHPRPNDASLFHGYFVPSEGNWYTSDGERLDPPFYYEDLTCVWDVESEDRDAWIWDIRTNRDSPEVLYTTVATDDVEDHRYQYSRYADGEWRTTPVADTRQLVARATGGLEDHYSPGLYFDHQSSSDLFLARGSPETNTDESNTRRGVELERWRIGEDGERVEPVHAITEDSATNQFRPVSPVPREAGDESPIEVLWMHDQAEDTYVFNRFTTSIRAVESSPE